MGGRNEIGPEQRSRVKNEIGIQRLRASRDGKTQDEAGLGSCRLGERRRANGLGRLLDAGTAVGEKLRDWTDGSNCASLCVG
jgi:hypothetical protein